jgi:hypothetical protein
LSRPRGSAETPSFAWATLGAGYQGWGEGRCGSIVIFYWNELRARDVEGAKAFYGKIAGWQFEGMPMEAGIYWARNDGEAPVAAS